MRTDDNFLRKFYFLVLIFSCMLPFLIEFPKLCVGERGFLLCHLDKLHSVVEKSLSSVKENEEILPFS